MLRVLICFISYSEISLSWLESYKFNKRFLKFWSSISIIFVGSPSSNTASYLYVIVVPANFPLFIVTFAVCSSILFIFSGSIVACIPFIVTFEYSSCTPSIDSWAFSWLHNGGKSTVNGFPITWLPSTLISTHWWSAMISFCIVWLKFCKHLKSFILL